MTRVQDVKEILARIDAARRARPLGAVAFDGDGTLWSGDVGDDFLHAFLVSGKVEPPAAAAMRELARAHGVIAPHDGLGLAQALYDAHLAGRVPEEGFYEMVAYACGGWTTQAADAFAHAAVERAGLGERYHPEACRVLEWAQAEGIEVFVVSASPCFVVVLAVRGLGIDAGHVVAATPVADDGALSAAVLRPIPYGEGKVTRLRERLGARPLYAAFGDNVFDVPLLRAAEVKVAVRPKPRLVERATDVPGLVELARL